MFRFDSCEILCLTDRLLDDINMPNDRSSLIVYLMNVMMLFLQLKVNLGRHFKLSARLRMEWMCK